ncbi:MAG: hypothetical protein MUF04_00195 [Akkermansiaceae bacterium]|jgi:hypothetical protein|nr:hypothetical protein [Akkermansiaceae bacterium]
MTPGPPPKAAQFLDSVFFAPLREALAKIRTRSCCVLEDLDFVLLAVARVLQESASGSDCFPTHALRWPATTARALPRLDEPPLGS